MYTPPCTKLKSAPSSNAPSCKDTWFRFPRTVWERYVKSVCTVTELLIATTKANTMAAIKTISAVYQTVIRTLMERFLTAFPPG